MKLKSILALSAVMTLGLSSVSFAAGWQHGNYRTNDWKYLNSNGSYASGWQAIDADGDGTGEYYYFDQAGWLKMNTDTPDGNTVNENGQWVVDGVVQTVDMSTVQEKDNSFKSLPGGRYVLSYMVYNYGDKVGVLDKTVKSVITMGSMDKNSITLYFTTERIDGTSIMFSKEFEKQKSGEYVYTNGDSKTYLTWDVASRNITTDDEERYCVYDLEGSNTDGEAAQN